MTKLTYKLVDNNEVKGFVIDLDGMEFVLPPLGVFSNIVFMDLVNAGYTFSNYSYETWADAAGNSILDLPEKNINEYGLDVRAQMNDYLTDLFPESAASKYYTFKPQFTISKEPVNVEISTREELVDYINNMSVTNSTTGYSVDTRPLNSFVDKKALFTFDDIIKGTADGSYSRDNVITILRRIFNRGMFQDFYSYEITIKHLRDFGVLATDTPTHGDFLNAYFSWGISGLRDSITDIHVEYNSSTPIDLPDFDPELVPDRLKEDGTISQGNSYSWTSSVSGMIDDHLNLHYLGKVVNIQDKIRSVGVNGVSIEDGLVLPDRNYYARANSINFDGYHYKRQKLNELNCVDTLVMSLISDSGAAYKVKITMDTIVFYRDNKSFIRFDNFRLGTIYPQVTVPWKFGTADMYKLYFKAYLKAKSLSKSIIRKVPVSSTLEMLRQRGLSTITALRYISRNCVANRDIYKSCTLFDCAMKTRGFPMAIEEWASPVPDYFLNYVGLTESDFESKEDLVNIVEDMLNDNSQLFEKKDAFGGDAKNALFYYEDLRFIYDCLYGDIFIDATGDGVFADNEFSLRELIDILLTGSFIIAGEGAPMSQVIDAVDRVCDELSIDMKELLKPRNEGVKGYIRDIAELNYLRGELSGNWVYVDTVYREASALPEDKQRDFCFVGIFIPRSCHIRKLLTNIVRNSINDKELNPNLKNMNMLDKNVGFFAASLFFGLISGNIDTSQLPKDSYGSVIFPLPNKYNNDVVNIVLTQGFFKDLEDFKRKELGGCVKTGTLYDYVKYELPTTGANASGGFVYYCVNATITPWKVIPHTGWEIKSKSFSTNFESGQKLIPILGEQAANAKIANEEAGSIGLKDYGLRRYMVTYDQKDPIVSYALDPNSFDEFSIDSVLSSEASTPETIELYERRWSLHNQDKIVVRMPLKSDNVWSCFAYYDNAEVVENIEYAEDYPDMTFDRTSYLTHTKFETMSGINDKQQRSIEANFNKLDRVSFSTLNPDFTLTQNNLLAGTFHPVVPYLITGRAFEIYGSGVAPIPFQNLTINDLMSAVNSGNAIRISQNKFLFRAISGFLILEVNS